MKGGPKSSLRPLLHQVLQLMLVYTKKLKAWHQILSSSVDTAVD